mmetsp:Transcript_6592/g.15958  ORF Transcript_6592/g.15958 Transcript_6592/m.15958 type:complete len:325 (+) Transcript_6592:1304-2278(+)
MARHALYPPSPLYPKPQSSVCTATEGEGMVAAANVPLASTDSRDVSSSPQAEGAEASKATSTSGALASSPRMVALKGACTAHSRVRECEPNAPSRGHALTPPHTANDSSDCTQRRCARLAAFSPSSAEAAATEPRTSRAVRGERLRSMSEARRTDEGRRASTVSRLESDESLFAEKEALEAKEWREMADMPPTEPSTEGEYTEAASSVSSSFAAASSASTSRACTPRIRLNDGCRRRVRSVCFADRPYMESTRIRSRAELPFAVPLAGASASVCRPPHDETERASSCRSFASHSCCSWIGVSSPSASESGGADELGSIFRRSVW